MVAEAIFNAHPDDLRPGGERPYPGAVVLVSTAQGPQRGTVKWTGIRLDYKGGPAHWIAQVQPDARAIVPGRTEGSLWLIESWSTPWREITPGEPPHPEVRRVAPESA